VVVVEGLAREAIKEEKKRCRKVKCQAKTWKTKKN